MTITRKIVDGSRVKLTLYHDLPNERPGVYGVRKGGYKGLVSERLIVGVYAFKFALELVIE